MAVQTRSQFPEATECRHLPVGLFLSPIGWKQCYVIGSSLSIQLTLASLVGSREVVGSGLVSAPFGR